MVSGLELLNRQTYRPSGGVSYRLPVRAAPQYRGPAITPRGPVPQGGGGPLQINLEAIVRNQQRHQQAQAPGGGNPWGPLGGVIKGAGKVGMGALTVLDYPRALVNAVATEGAAELIDLLGDEDRYPTLDTNFSLNDIWRNTREHKGFGETLVEPIMGPEGDDWNIWVRRALGFAGDVAADPFTYVNPVFGVGADIGKANRFRYLNQLADAQGAARAAEGGAQDLVLAAMGEVPSAADFGVARIGREAAEQAGQRVRALGGEESLDLMARRGVNIASDAQLEAMGLGQHGLRLGGPQGYVVPGTEGLSRAVTRVTAPIKESLSGSALGRGARALRTPKGYIGQDMTQAMERLMTGRGPWTAQQALRAFALDESMRQAGGTFAALGNRVLQQADDATRDAGAAGRAEMIRQIEEQGADNVWAKVAPQMMEAAREAGAELPEMTPIRLPDGTEVGYVMPHVLSREAFNFFSKLRAGENPLAATFRRKLGITDKTLREEGGFMLKRELRPNADGTPNILDIDGRKVSIERGSVAELNEKLGEVLREAGFTGKLYETDPVEAWRRYIQATKRDVASDAAYRGAAERGFEHFAIAPDKPQGWDPVGGRVEMAPAEEGGVPRYRVTANKRPKPEGDGFYEFVEDTEATRKRNRNLTRRKKGSFGADQVALAEEYKLAGEAERTRIAGELDRVAQQAWGDITSARQALRETASEAHGRVRSAVDKNTVLELHRQKMEGIVNWADEQIAAYDRKVRSLKGAAQRRIKRESKAMLDEMDRIRTEAIQRRNALDAEMRRGQEAVADEAERVSLAAQKDRRALRRRKTFELTKAEERAQTKMINAENAARERRRQWVKRKEGRKYLSKRDYDKAAATLREAENGAAGREYRHLTNRRNQLRRRLVDIDDELQTLEREAIKKRTDLEGAIDRFRRTEVDRPLSAKLQDDAKDVREMFDRLDVLRRERANLGTELRNVETQFKNSKLTKAADVMADYNEQERWVFSQVANPDVEATRLRYRNARNAREEWDRVAAAEDEHVARGIQQAETPTEALPPFPHLAGTQAREVATLERTLGSVKARKWQRLRERLNMLDDAIAKAPRGGKQRLIRERSAARQWMAENADFAARMEAADARLRELRQLEARDAGRLRTVHPDIPEQTRAAEFVDIENREKAQLARARDFEQRQRDVANEAIPEISAAQADVDKAVADMLNAEQQTAGVAIDVGTETGKRIGAIRGTQETLQRKADDARAMQTFIEEAQGTVQNDYLVAMQDQEQARQWIRDINEVTTAASIERPASAAAIVEGKKVGAPSAKAVAEVGVPTEANLARVQPLNKALEDTQKIVAANPTGNDNLMNQIEGVLTAESKALAEVTRGIDVPMNEVNGILRDARNGKLAPVLKAQLRSDIMTLRKGGAVVMDRSVESLYRSIAETVDSKWFGRNMTFLTNFFKTYATLSPGFHVRNAMSAIFMNATEGVGGAEMRRAYGLWRDFVKAEDPIAFMRHLRETDQNVYDAFRATFASGSGGQFLERGVSELRTGGTRRKERLFSNKATLLSQKAGVNLVEGPQRLALALHYTSAGKGLDGALNAVTRVHFDYSQVSKFDENMKRFIPFWTFMSRNLPLQLTQMWMKPKLYLRYQSFARNFAGVGPELMPQYIEQAGGYQLGELETPSMPLLPGGMPIVLQPDLPHLRLQDDFNRLANVASGQSKGQILADVNPWLTAPLEYLLDEDFFTGKRYGPDDYTKASGLGIPLALALAPLGGARQGANGEWYFKDSALASLKSVIPPLERTSRLAPPVLTQGGTPDDRIWESYLRFFGAPVRTISEDQMRGEASRRYYNAKDRAELLAATGG